MSIYSDIVKQASLNNMLEYYKIKKLDNITEEREDHDYYVCPFCNVADGSFYVFSDDSRYYCTNCNSSGTIVKLVHDIEFKRWNFKDSWYEIYQLIIDRQSLNIVINPSKEIISDDVLKNIRIEKMSTNDLKTIGISEYDLNMILNDYHLDEKGYSFKEKNKRYYNSFALIRIIEYYINKYRTVKRNNIETHIHIRNDYNSQLDYLTKDLEKKLKESEKKNSYLISKNKELHDKLKESKSLYYSYKIKYLESKRDDLSRQIGDLKMEQLPLKNRIKATEELDSIELGNIPVDDILTPSDFFNTLKMQGKKPEFHKTKK